MATNSYLLKIKKCRVVRGYNYCYVFWLGGCMNFFCDFCSRISSSPENINMPVDFYFKPLFLQLIFIMCVLREGY
ncbi:MAG: hypothetical protein ACJAUP_000240 [Cellvibrionaceae bacterium]|jgi:hypothetical protein